MSKCAKVDVKQAHKKIRRDEATGIGKFCVRKRKIINDKKFMNFIRKTP